MDSIAYSRYEGPHLAELPEQQQQATAHLGGFAEGFNRRGETIRKLSGVWALGITTLSCCQVELLLLP